MFHEIDEKLSTDGFARVCAPSTLGSCKTMMRMREDPRAVQYTHHCGNHHAEAGNCSGYVPYRYTVPFMTKQKMQCMMNAQWHAMTGWNGRPHEWTQY